MKKTKPSVVLFTKHVGWMDYTQLADALANLGFDGADLTVRPGGHVLPENVERDLPKAVEAIRKVGLEVMMITTDISDPRQKDTEPILKTASALGIPFYRIGAWSYRGDRGILEQLNEYKPKMKDLAAMNAHYKICAGYHNHSGYGQIGGGVWDIFEMLREVDPQWIGSNFDTGHAVAEGGCGAWETYFRLISSRIKMSAVKDFAWEKHPEKRWQPTFPPVGDGMVKWSSALALFKSIDFTGPFSMHFEYGIAGDSEEEKQKNLLSNIRRDLSVFRALLLDAGLG
jgi:sugar phosphate isomerase/epimerase